MTLPDPSVVVRKLSLHSSLTGEAKEALRTFLGHPQAFAAGALVARAGDPADLISIVRDGVGCRMAMLPDGERQIHCILFAGDAADVEASLLTRRSDYIQAITPCSIWLVPKTRLAALPRTPNGLAEAFLREAVLRAEITREWVVNLGRRTANERIAHLICELCARMDAMGIGADRVYPFPFTQQDIADAQGLSTVHVNRVLKQLTGGGLFELRLRTLRVLNRRKLEEAGLFDPAYLHFRSRAAA